METHNNNNIEKEKNKIIKFTVFIFTLGIVVMIAATIIMTIGIIQFDIKVCLQCYCCLSGNITLLNHTINSLMVYTQNA